MLSKDELLMMLKDAGVLLEGHFILTSGRHSNQYLQMAQALQDAKLTEKLCKNLLEHFKDTEIDLVISPAVGGILVGYEISKQLGVKNIFCEREQEIMTLRRGFEINPGERVLVVEDVVTTGGSVKEVVKVVEESGGIVAGIGVLADRSNGRITFNCPFKALLSLDIISYDEQECPLCKQGLPAVKPGSRSIK